MCSSWPRLAAYQKEEKLFTKSHIAYKNEVLEMTLFYLMVFGFCEERRNNEHNMRTLQKKKSPSIPFTPVFN
jgi:glycopeptide antibiotics resistance protein